MKSKLFEHIGGNQFKIIKENKENFDSSIEFNSPVTKALLIKYFKSEGLPYKIEKNKVKFIWHRIVSASSEVSTHPTFVHLAKVVAMYDGWYGMGDIIDSPQHNNDDELMKNARKEKR